MTTAKTHLYINNIYSKFLNFKSTKYLFKLAIVKKKMYLSDNYVTQILI